MSVMHACNCWTTTLALVTTFLLYPHLNTVVYLYQRDYFVQASLKRSQATALVQLTVAAAAGDIETVEDIVARGVNVDQGDYDGRTTLHIAVAERKSDVVSLLLDKGAKYDVVDTWGTTPLMQALSLDELAIADALCAKGAKLGTVPIAFLLGATENEEKLRLVCTKAGVNINAIDVDGKTALHHACALRMWRSCQNLLSLGANVNATDRCGVNPHHRHFDV